MHYLLFIRFSGAIPFLSFQAFSFLWGGRAFELLSRILKKNVLLSKYFGRFLVVFFFSFLFQTAGKTVELFLIESFIVVSMFWRLFQAAVCFPSIWNGFSKWSRLASSGAVSIIFKNRFQWYNFFQSSWIVAEWILYDERLGFVESTAMFLSVEFEFQEMFHWLHWKVQTFWSISETGNSFENSWTIFVSMIARVTSWVWNDLKKKKSDCVWCRVISTFQSSLEQLFWSEILIRFWLSECRSFFSWRCTRVEKLD